MYIYVYLHGTSSVPRAPASENAQAKSAASVGMRARRLSFWLTLNPKRDQSISISISIYLSIYQSIYLHGTSSVPRAPASGNAHAKSAASVGMRARLLSFCERVSESGGVMRPNEAKPWTDTLARADRERSTRYEALPSCRRQRGMELGLG